MKDDQSESDKTRSVVILSKGMLIGHYRIIEKIGAGGMGEVYLAEDNALDRKVALKFLPPHLCQDSDCRARFKREAQAAARLDHPNIVSVFEVGEFQGRPFFAMQHVEGQTLKEVIAGKTLPLDRILEIGIQVCDGLQAAHDKGITHRDIKSSNILIDSHGRARIVDFGLASVLGSDPLTKTGSTLGTVGYMSPEQVRGDKVDHRTDLFSLGVVLYELITGHSPFKSESEAATLNAITNTKPELLARFRREIPDGIQTIIDKALDKDVATRYQHADELVADLGRIGKGTRLVPVAHGRRSRLLIISLAIVGLVILALILKPWRLGIMPTHEVQASTNWLAVMYFDNVAEPGDSKRLGDIATNLLITGLSQSEYLKVMSSQRLYDLLKQVGKEGVKTIDRATASEIAKRADAKWMLTGSILQSEPVMVLTSQLINVSSGGVIASQRITGNQGENIFAVIDRLIEDVKKSKALPAAIKSEPPVNVAEVTTHSQEAYKRYLEGIEYRDKRYFSEAQQSFHKAIGLDSTFAIAYLGLALSGVPSQEQLAALAKAEQYADRASDRERRLIYMYGHAVETFDLQSTLREYRQYLDRYPDDKWAWWNYGWAYWQSFGSADSALMFMNRAIALDPTYKIAYNLIGYLYGAALGQFDKGFAVIDKYIALAPDEANPYDTRGDLFALAGQLDSAIESYRKALSIKSDFIESISKLGRMYLFAGQFQRAESLYRTNASSFGNPERGTVRQWLVDMGTFEGKFKNTLRLAGDCISANKLDGMESANAEFYFRKGEIFDCQRMWDSAAANARICEKLIAELTPADTGLYDISFIRWYYRAGDTARAARLLQRLSAPFILKMRQGGSEHLCAMGEFALARAEYPRAIECFSRADSIYYNQPALYRLGEAYWEFGDASSAIKVLEKLLKDYHELLHSSPYMFASAHYLLGRAYEATGDKMKARSSYEKFLTIWKDADLGLKEINDAKVRLARLKGRS